jgi:hypothetical protein
MAPDASTESAGSAYGELIKEQLEAERARKASLEQRGITVITTSGVLVSLLFGLGAVVTSAKAFQVPALARILLVVAVGLFVLAALAGLVLNSPRQYEEAELAYLDLLYTKDVWDASVSLGGRRSAEMRLKILRKARQVNRDKAKWLVAAVVFEVGAVAFVAASVIVILLNG